MEQLGLHFEPPSQSERRREGLSREAAARFDGFEAVPRKPLVVFKKDGGILRDHVGVDEAGVVIGIFQLPDGKGYGLLVRFEERRENMAPATGDRLVGYLYSKVEDPLGELNLKAPAGRQEARTSIPARRSDKDSR